jgi:type IV pilus assembly protein PilB
VVALGLDLKAKSLSSFEAFVISQVDGRSTLEQLRQITSLSKIEIQSVFRSLVERSLIQFKAPAPPPLPKRPAPASKREETQPAVITEPFDVPEPRRQPAPAPAVPKVPSLGNAPTAPRGFPAVPARKAPEHVYEAPLQKAIRLELEGKVGEAIGVLERAIAVSPDPAALYNRLALALIKERRDLAGATAMLEKAIEHDPQNDVYSRNLMKVLGMAGSLTGKKKRPRR